MAKPVRSAVDDYDLARQRVSASPLFLRGAEVERGIGLLLLGQSHLLRAIDPMLREAGIGRAHYRLLSHVARWPGLAMSDLILLSGVSKQALSRIARDLQGRELIRSDPGQRDRRRRELRPSAAGQELADAVSVALQRVMMEAYSGAGQDAVSGYWRVLEGLLPVATHAHLADMVRRR